MIISFVRHRHNHRCRCHQGNHQPRITVVTDVGTTTTAAAAAATAIIIIINIIIIIIIINNNNNNNVVVVALVVIVTITGIIIIIDTYQYHHQPTNHSLMAWGGLVHSMCITPAGCIGLWRIWGFIHGCDWWHRTVPGHQQPSLQRHRGNLVGYRQTSNMIRILVGNNIVDHSDVVGASPVGAAPTTSSFSTKHLASMGWAKTTARRDKKRLSLGIWYRLY